MSEVLAFPIVYLRHGRGLWVVGAVDAPFVESQQDLGESEHCEVAVVKDELDLCGGLGFRV